MLASTMKFQGAKDNTKNYFYDVVITLKTVRIYIYTQTNPASSSGMNCRKVMIRLTQVAKLCRYVKRIFLADACLNSLPLFLKK